MRKLNWLISSKKEKIDAQKDKIKEFEDSIKSTQDDNNSIDLSLKADKEKMLVADMEASTLQDKIEDLQKIALKKNMKNLINLESLDEEIGFRNGSKVSINKRVKAASDVN